jgi:diguanylate cyclase (GGDEF)-like protein/PAS domain S-box-containing protein
MRRRSLQARFTWLVVLVAGFFALVAGALAYRVAYGQALEAGRDTLSSLALTVEKTAAVGAFASDQVLLQEIIDGLLRNPLVARVSIQLASGLQLQGPAGAAGQAVGGTGMASLTVTRVLNSPFDANEPLGQMDVVGDLARMQDTARSQARTLAVLMVSQIALIAVLLQVAVTHLVGRPMARLSRDLRAMQPGTPARVAVPAGHEHDEIGTLAHSANDLLAANQVAFERERELRAEVEAMQAQYRQIFDSTSAGIFVLDRQGRLINGNPTVMKIMGLPVQALRELPGDDFLRAVFARPDLVQAMVHQAMQRGETISADLELRWGGQGSRWVHCLISVQAAQDDPPGTVVEGVMYDITERRRAEHAVRERAESDMLTGLKNRAAAEAVLGRFLADPAPQQARMALLYLDLDGFKQVNDLHGHLAGDQVLRTCAERLLAVVRRSNDLVARIGGDEFLIALFNVGSDDPVVAQLGAALVEALAQPIQIDGGVSVRVGVSIGIACHPLHGRTLRELVEAADAAMYQVKRSGKNAYAMASGAAASAH